jgi:hypothetical protein
MTNFIESSFARHVGTRQCALLCLDHNMQLGHGSGINCKHSGWYMSQVRGLKFTDRQTGVPAHILVRSQLPCFAILNLARLRE